MNISNKINEFSYNAEKLRYLQELDRQLFDNKVNNGLTDMEIFFEEVQEGRGRINIGELPLHEEIDVLYKKLKDMTYNDTHLYALYQSISIYIKHELYEKAEKIKKKIIKYEEKHHLVILS